MTNVATKPVPGTRLRGFESAIVLITGVIVIPLVLGLVFNSYSEPDAAAYVRMAFATVAGQTIAIVTAVGVLISRVIERVRPSAIVMYTLIAIVVTGSAVASIASASDLLLQRLSALG